MKKLGVAVVVLVLCFLPLSNVKAETKADVEKRLDQIEKELADLKKEVVGQKEAWEKNMGFLKSIKLGGEIRTRWEIQNGHDLYRDSTDDFFLLRTRFSIEATPVENIKVYIQAQDSRVWGEERDIGRTVTGDTRYARTVFDDNELDLKQGYFELQNIGGLPLTARIGRQVLSYGDERLVGSNDWDNLGRSFDALKLMIHPAEGVDVDIWYAKIVEELKDDRLDEDDDIDFYGLYATTSNFADVGLKTADLYLLVLRDNGVDSIFAPKTANLTLPVGSVKDLEAKDNSTIWTIGSRLVGNIPVMEAIDYRVEGAVQLGTIGSSNIHAWAMFGEVGYSMPDVMWKPRIGAVYAFASGDGSPSDEKSSTFNNLFPTNHDKYGLIDFVNWQNIHDIGGNITVQPLENLTARIEYHHFALAEEQDAWYGSPRGDLWFDTDNTKGENGLGDEINAVLKYTYNKYVALEAGYALFLHGDLIREDETRGGGNGSSINESNWGYIQAKVSF